ncbi:LapA family protein [Mesorhizobium sp. 1B3]|uniref:LapA family protein n=1 Tax=Mesorhizobium sp. 1B3 TaxID=3243599 RepID=UPI003D95857C
MLNRLILIVVLVPLAIVLIALAVANRGVTAFTLDPFNPGNPALTVQLPLFVLLFAAVALGLLVGGAVTWWKQGRYRRLARQREQELHGLRAATPKTPAQQAVPPALPGPGG